MKKPYVWIVEEKAGLRWRTVDGGYFSLRKAEALDDAKFLREQFPHTEFRVSRFVREDDK